MLGCVFVLFICVYVFVCQYTYMCGIVDLFVWYVVKFLFREALFEGDASEVNV